MIAWPTLGHPDPPVYVIGHHGTRYDRTAGFIGTTIIPMDEEKVKACRFLSIVSIKA
jgi:hypothetical protein